jgi:DNA uptake protein ComE-like DNA-binding protein
MLQRNFIKSFFSYSKSEIRGILVLLFIIISLIIVRIVLNTSDIGFKLAYEKESVKKDTSCLHRGSMCAEINPSKDGVYDKTLLSTKIFDPNTATFIELVNRGFSSNVSAKIIKYREKGGVFHKVDELLRIYGIDTALLAKQRQYIFIDSSYYLNRQANIVKRTYFSSIIEINSADTFQLMNLSGIGPVLSRRIIKYRELMGGFYHTNQLTDVYGISDSLFSLFSKNIVADTSLLRKINLNSCTIDDLEKHPYISHYQAKAIMSYRRLIGPFSSREQLIENSLLPVETYQKVAPYFTLN